MHSAGTDRDVIHPDKAVRENAKKYVKTCVDFATEFGTDIVCGPLYSCLLYTSDAADE